MLRLKKYLFTFFLVLPLVFIFVQPIIASELLFNYAEALQLSLHFFDANRCGPVSSESRLEWRGDCHVKDMYRSYEDLSLPISYIMDNIEVFDPDNSGYIDVSGGFHDAGDHMKFGLPQSYTASTIGWAYYEFKEAFQETGTEEHMLEILKHFNDYFLRSTFRDENGDVIAFVYMVGEGTIDHNYWGPPELQANSEHNDRPVEVAYPESPASDQAAGAAAALTLMYLNYQDIDPVYAEKCLDTAIALYEFAREYRGLGRSGGFYSSSNDNDEMSWAAVWLYIATGELEYIDHIMAVDSSNRYTGYVSAIIDTTENSWQNIWTHCWDTVWGGVFMKLANLFPDNELYDYLARWNLEYWSGGQVPHEDPADTNYLEPTPAGFGVISTWGSARYNATAQFLAMVYQKYNPERTDITDWAKSQMEYLMGDNPMGYSYIVGYSDEYVQHPHHRAAHGSLTNSMEDPPEHRHTLWGALVGGPGPDDEHVDSTIDYIYNEVAIDYNAGFVGALAGLYLLYGEGDKPIENFPPAVPEVEEFYTEARLEQENNERTQITITLNNDTVYPPRIEDSLSLRYYFDISELIDAGQTIDDISYDIYYDENEALYDGSVQTSGPFHWDGSVYYVEIAWSEYQIHGKREVHLALMAGLDSKWEANWDPSNDFSREGITEVDSRTPRIPVYLNGVKVYGEEPPSSGTVPVAPELSVILYEELREVLLEWSSVPMAEGYQVIWDADIGLPNNEIIEIGDRTSYTIENLSENNTYTFYVRAYNHFGVSNSSNVEKVIIDGSNIEFLLGDINNDGVINSLDLTLLGRYLIGSISEFEFEYGKKAADFNEDGYIDSLDYVFLSRFVLTDDKL
ncbi:glycoside hydrolase family 9 protein [Natronospora cellulosivora (SeqCode)]